MNYIVLEGTSLYLVMIMIAILMFITLGCILFVIVSDKRGFVLKSLLAKEKEKVMNLSKENFVLRLRCGEFDIDEK